MKIATLIFSGGLDSSTLLYKLIQEDYEEIHALSFDYGQRHKRELVAAKAVILRTKEDCGTRIVHRIVDLSSIFSLISRTGHSLLDDSVQVPKGPYSKEASPSTVVPGRNLIFLSVGATYCEAHQIPDLYYGAHKNDQLVYPDCRSEFIDAAKITIERSSAWSPVRLVAPFEGLEKSDVVRLGLKLNVPYELTWSCYEGGQKPCGKCPTCIERIEAFSANGALDPLATR